MAATSQHQQALTTFCIAISALTAGSIFCFPLFGPTLTRDLGLNLTQTNTIFGGAVLGEYLTAAIWGVIADATGPRVLSIAAAVLSVVGYQLMGLVVLRCQCVADELPVGHEATLLWVLVILHIRVPDRP